MRHLQCIPEQRNHMAENLRALALDMLLELHKGDTYSNLLIGQVFEKYDYLSGQEKAFLKRLTEGVIERMITLDYVIDQFSKTPVKKMKPAIIAILRMGVYQILYMDSVPDSAACNEAVKLAIRKHFQGLKGFVNGVLRSIARDKEKIVWPDADREPEKHLSVMYAVPQELIRLWIADYGYETARTMACAFLAPGKVSVRMREDMSDDERQTLLQDWQSSGVEVEVSPYLPYAYLLSHMEGAQRLAGFADGRVTIQDVSSMLVTECADLHDGDLVLDVCAAPGGKSMHAATKCPMAHVEARDVSAYRVQLMEENVARMGLTNMDCICADACIDDPQMHGRADVLYLDVPCSGFGIIGHKQDIKYGYDPAKMESLIALQKQIVETCLPYVKKGGTVIYSTCTVHRAENDEMREWMLKTFDLEAVSLDAQLPKALRSRDTAEGSLQLIPGIHAADGFYIAKFRRKQ